MKHLQKRLVRAATAVVVGLGVVITALGLTVNNWTSVRRNLIAILVLIPIVFTQGFTAHATTVNSTPCSDPLNCVASITGLTVGADTYDIAFVFDDYISIFGSELFPNAVAILTAMNIELNATVFQNILATGNLTPNPIAFIPFGPGSFFGNFGLEAKRTFNGGGGMGWSLQVPGQLHQSNDSVLWAVPTLVSPVPVPAAFPLFGTGLAILGFLGWRRRRKAQAV